MNPTVEIALFQGDSEEQAGRLVLFADQPNLSIHSHEHGIYGDYWFNHADKDRNVRMQQGHPSPPSSFSVEIKAIKSFSPLTI